MREIAAWYSIWRRLFCKHWIRKIVLEKQVGSLINDKTREHKISECVRCGDILID